MQMGVICTTQHLNSFASAVTEASFSGQSGLFFPVEAYMKTFTSSLAIVFIVSSQFVNPLTSQQHQVTGFSPGYSVNQQDNRQKSVESRKRNFAIARNLLLSKGVPFDAEVLLQDDWKRTLAPVFARMPEMQQVRYVARPLAGVELADTLYLPEKVQVAGDLVIVGRHLVFEGSDVLIKGNYNISIFPR
jgi:hypothetical protein